LLHAGLHLKQKTRVHGAGAGRSCKHTGRGASVFVVLLVEERPFPLVDDGEDVLLLNALVLVRLDDQVGGLVNKVALHLQCGTTQGSSRQACAVAGTGMQGGRIRLHARSGGDACVSPEHSACHTQSVDWVSVAGPRLDLVLLHGILRDAGPARKLLAKELGRLCQLHAKHLQACTRSRTPSMQLHGTHDIGSEVGRREARMAAHSKLTA